MQPQGNAIAFIDNHDTQRSGAPLTYKNGELYRIATIFMLAHPYGYPKVMSSYYFNDNDQGPPSVPVHQGSTVNCEDGRNWVCEHRWKGVGPMANFRRQTDSTGQSVSNWQSPSDDRIAFSRGNKGFVAINRNGGSWDTTLQTGLPAGNYVDLINQQQVSVDGSGNAHVSVGGMDALALGVWSQSSGHVDLNTTRM